MKIESVPVAENYQGIYQTLLEKIGKNGHFKSADGSLMINHNPDVKWEQEFPDGKGTRTPDTNFSIHDEKSGKEFEIHVSGQVGAMSGISQEEWEANKPTKEELQSVVERLG